MVVICRLRGEVNPAEHYRYHCYGIGFNTLQLEWDDDLQDWRQENVRLLLATFFSRRSRRALQRQLNRYWRNSLLVWVIIPARAPEYW